MEHEIPRREHGSRSLQVDGVETVPNFCEAELSTASMCLRKLRLYREQRRRTLSEKQEDHRSKASSPCVGDQSRGWCQDKD
jgi:hypothetical protein